MPTYKGQLTSKLPNVKETIFSKMSNMATEYQAINLAQGFPDFNPDPDLLHIASKHLYANKHQYAPMPGIIELRTTIGHLVKQWYSQEYNPQTEITIVPGATAGIYAAITALIKENDEVIIFEPAYDCYVPAILLQGAKPVYVSLQHPEYKIDWGHVKRLINFKTKAIIINTPNNPTGTILSSEDLIHLREIVKNTDIVIISDEVYEHILFDGYEHQSIARFPLLAERSVIVSSFGKTLHCTGWKLGYILAPENLMLEIRKAYQYMIFSTNTPFQYAINEYLNTFPERINLNNFYGEKKNIFVHSLKTSRFKITQPQGTYFALLDYSKISDKPDTEFAEELTKTHHIASIPTSVFYRNNIDNKTLRFCFAKETNTLLAAAEILCQL